MENKLFLNQLNSIKESFYTYDSSICDRVNFYVGNHLEILRSSLSKNIYFGKVAIFSYESTFVILVKDIKKELSLSKISTIDYLFERKEKASIESLSKLFSLPDDIRAIIVLDSKLSKIAGYFATIKKLPLYVVSCGLDVGECLENTMLIKAENCYDIFTLSNKKHVIIDREIAKKLNVNQAVAFDYAVNNIVSLIDEKINSFFTNEKINAEIYNKKNKAVIESFSIMKENVQDRYEKLVKNCVICGLVNGIYKENYIKNSSLVGISLLLYKDFWIDSSLLVFTIKLLKLYAILCQRESQEIFCIKDYNGLAESISKILEIDEQLVLNVLLVKEQKYKTSKKTHVDFVNKFEEELIPLAKTIERAKSIHLALGGEDLNKEINSQDIKNIVKIAGFFSPNVTGLSLLVLLGINEII